MTLRWLSAGLGVPVVGLLILGAVTTSAQQTPAQPHQTSPQQQPTAKPANIDRNGVLMLIRSTLLALDHANKTGNYTVLRDLGAPGFQVNTAAKLAEIFAKQRGEKLDLSGVAVIDPQLSLLPQIEPNGFLHMAGFFPSVPSQVNFELLFAPVEGQWRVFGVSLSVGQSAPVAPEPPAEKAVVSQRQAAPPKPAVSAK
ncbi:hypothetical protein G8O24_36890 [Bradyrhizobium sp. INPA01-394B]|uniref:DUF4864 domain-containing protein n=1 Tax=Bradyrhizobium campsiandrae TaxID=1729892 RepID=A0ABR7U5W0_9BRAD|nr:hypothetical protein [Bradyrhizobium campsiandrae]MBC9882883.1 hypothetical protein [Bradyrhizobium campsiandrae]MBC9979203.1 hypothetical protein [Bradyrhizobium campsiandrae]